jgi:hypothetical protein
MNGNDRAAAVELTEAVHATGITAHHVNLGHEHVTASDYQRLAQLIRWGHMVEKNVKGRVGGGNSQTTTQGE